MICTLMHTYKQLYVSVSVHVFAKRHGVLAPITMPIQIFISCGTDIHNVCMFRSCIVCVVNKAQQLQLRSMIATVLLAVVKKEEVVEEDLLQQALAIEDGRVAMTSLWQ